MNERVDYLGNRVGMEISVQGFDWGLLPESAQVRDDEEASLDTGRRWIVM